MTLTVVLPMAGLGTRLRPLTWSRPKPLVYVAGDTILGHILRNFQQLPPQDVHYVFIIGYLGDQIREYMAKEHPELRVTFVEQPEALGQSHALYLAREHLQGPTLVLFADTLLETDFTFLAQGPEEGYVWVREVEDPRRFGIAFLDEQGYVRRIVEKPDTTEHKLAVVGAYYFPRGEDLAEAVTEQLRRDLRTRGEYYIADAINLLLDAGRLRLKPIRVTTWLDAGTPDALLALNRYLLDHGRANTVEALRPGVVIVPPVFIDPTAEVEQSVIGPYATLGPGVKVRDSLVRESIVASDAELTNVILTNSLIGSKARVQDTQGVFNIGDHSRVAGA
ncbi:MAG: NTP transferase domain-containing protein [Chloroflexi bacterium]|nr:NTP transferase domain-containing protein [Chloroflexota bacterium]